MDEQEINKSVTRQPVIYTNIMHIYKDSIKFLKQRDRYSV